MNLNKIPKFFNLLVITLMVIPFFGNIPKKKSPNIIWILAEDIAPDLSCYGAKGVETPTLDQLAAEGILYKNAFCTAPVCSPSRSAIMTGMHQNAIGANQHRTANKKALPVSVKPITAYLREQGYYTALGCGYSGKTDLNFLHQGLFDGKDWKDRKKGQPFFAQITLPNTHRSWGRDSLNPIDIHEVELPPYYPDIPTTRRDWANGLEEIQIMDRLVAKILERLKKEGIEDETVIIFSGDNGRCHIRGKQFLYDPGLHVPLIIKWPGKVKGGAVDAGLYSLIDVSATILGIASADIPDHMHGSNIFDDDFNGREYVFAARDKMDDTHDAMRAVRSKKFKYILNLMPERPYLQYNRYKESQYPMMAIMNVMHLKGELNEVQRTFMANTKPVEELYDLEKDPHEINNIAKDPQYYDALKNMRQELANWRNSINDKPVSQTFKTGGWPEVYPTRNLAEWQTYMEKWERHLMEGGVSPRSELNKMKYEVRKPEE
ncbi:sulfatase [Fulvivirgaceae bacterium BMA10]|uniref:Sulfatase n=1 Tax=Splendidivirga corallicola TaxID=3051826 RepID=A0ABT8KN06_9BACT|nr:sulfatase [Fulvivirgaceae bacterium BMA10]